MNNTKKFILVTACLFSLVGIVWAADVKISALTLKGTPVAGDHTIIVDSVGGANKKITLGTLPVSTPMETRLGGAGAPDATELGYVKGLTSAAQTQLTAMLAKALGTGKGTLVGFSAANTPGTLAAGTDGDMLIADAASTLGIKWQSVPAWPLGSANGGTGVANGANNTITFTGNYTLGLTLTGNTGVTLPTSGTLLASGGALGTPASGVLTNCTGTPMLSPMAGAMTSGTGTVYPGSDGTNTGTKVRYFALTISGNTQTMTFAAPKGTPVAGDVLIVDIYTTGTSNVVDLTAYTAIGVTAPTAITASKLTTVGLIYSGQLTAWTIRAVGQQS